MEPENRTWASGYCYEHGYGAASDKYRPTVKDAASHGMDIAFCKYMGDEQSYEKGYHCGFVDSNLKQFGKKP